MKKILLTLGLGFSSVVFAVSDRDLRTQHWIENRIVTEIQSLAAPMLTPDQFSVAVSVELSPNEYVPDAEPAEQEAAAADTPDDLNIGLIQGRDIIERSQQSIREVQNKYRAQAQYAAGDYEVQSAALSFVFRSDVTPEVAQKIMQLAKSYVQSSFQIDAVVNRVSFDKLPDVVKADGLKPDAKEEKANGIRDKIYDLAALFIVLLTGMLFVWVAFRKTKSDNAAAANLPAIRGATNKDNGQSKIEREITRYNDSLGPLANDRGDIIPEVVREREHITQTINSRAAQVPRPVLQSLLNYWITHSEKDKYKVLHFFRNAGESAEVGQLNLEAPPATFELIHQANLSEEEDLNLIREMLVEISVARFCGVHVFQKSSDFLLRRTPALLVALLHELPDNADRGVLYSIMPQELQRGIWKELTKDEKNLLAFGVFALPSRIPQEKVIEVLERCRRLVGALEGGDFGPDSFSSEKTKLKFYAGLPLGARMNLWDSIVATTPERAEALLEQMPNVAALEALHREDAAEFLKRIPQEESFAVLSAMSRTVSMSIANEMGELYVAAWESSRLSQNDARAVLDDMSEMIDEAFADFAKNRRLNWIRFTTEKLSLVA